jgi:ribosomal-protein-alanine N-acetyltransferase
MEFEVIETERMFLKVLTNEVLRTLFENYSQAEIKTILGLTTDEEFIAEKTKIEGGYTTYDRAIFGFLLVLKENNETIGRAGYHNWYSRHKRAELGYGLSKEEHKRKGYMNEAITRIISYGFEILKLNRIEAFVGPENTASLSIVKRHGFTQEGYLKQHFVNEGKTYDSVSFALLKEEYQAQKK